MKYALSFMLLCVSSLSAQELSLAQKLQQSSVTIHAAGAQGSGVVVVRGNDSYVLTAAHVVASLRKTRESVDPTTGSKKTRIVFDDAKIVTELYESDQTVGETSLRAEVVRYSNANNGDDLALLRVRKKGVLTRGVEFTKPAITVPVGTDLLHVGSLLGQLGSNSVTTGIVSQVGRNLDGTTYDQSNCGAFPGSSGGGLFRKDNGLYVGMIVLGAGETFNLFVPIRRIDSWATRNGVKFIVDSSVEIPNDKELKSKPVEESGLGTGRARGEYSYLIKE